MVQTFLEQIEQADTIGIFGHIRPDGDCVGSCLGLYNYIKRVYGKKVYVFLEPIPEKFEFLDGAEQICHEPMADRLDLSISLDCGDRDRHGAFYDLFGSADHTMCLDHHRSNQGFGDYFYCDPDASSTCEVLYQHLDEKKIDFACAQCLYLGIVHDTGVFKYAACKETTMQIAGRLLAKGIDAQKIIDDTFYRVTFRQNRLCGQAVLNAKLDLNGEAISTFVSAQMLQEFGCGKEETEGIVDRLRIVEGVETAIFAYQLEADKKIKFSLRSISRVDVSRIAVAFGGGGHIRAAGFETDGSYEENLKKILEMIEEQAS